MVNRYKGELMAAAGELKTKRPELARAIDNALLGGQNKKGPTPRFEAVVNLARQGVWSPIERLLAHPYYQLEIAETPEDELENTRAIFYELAQPDLLLLEQLGDGEKSLSVQTMLDKAETFEEIIEVFNGIKFLAFRCRLQQEINKLMQTGAYVPLIEVKIVTLYESFTAAQTPADLVTVQSEVKLLQNEIQAFQRGINNFGSLK
jgi:hypothetical protein